MRYNLSITEKAEKQLDRLVYYLFLVLENQQAASHLLSSVETMYDRLGSNPYQFPMCDDIFLKRKGYRKAHLPDMSYHMIFEILDSTVYVLGIFHDLEQFNTKL